VRLGCGGCLTILILGFAAGIGTSAWSLSRVLEAPASTVPQTTSPEDAARAQQKLFRLIRGSTTNPVVLSEVELNAFVSRNIDRNDMPLDQPIVFLRDDDIVEIVGQVPLRRLVSDSPVGIVAGMLPDRWGAWPVSVDISARAQLERRTRTQLRLVVERVTLGRQRLPALALRLLFDPARLRFVRMTLPDTVADIRIQSGRVVIRTTSSRERT
jgi:hypothetical protein